MSKIENKIFLPTNKIMIDLRSDTLTKPTAGMLEAMMSAKVGDDVWGEDPSVNELEEKAAKMFDMQAAVFCPSGTMTNQIAIKVHTAPGDEVICDRASHIYNFEGGGIAFNSGASVRLIEGDRGRFMAQDVIDNINPDNIHFAASKLVAVENTTNRGGGSFYDFQELVNIKQVCNEYNLPFHLDGARLFNALAETPQNTADYGHLFDSISICLSKGLGAPVGSLLLGDDAFMQKARRIRKVFGGCMRQSGYLAAAGIYALDNNIARLKEDHHHAKKLGIEIANLHFVKRILPVDTNIVIFELADSISEEVIIDKMKQKGILLHAIGKNAIRLVTHLDFTEEMLVDTINAFREI